MLTQFVSSNATPTESRQTISIDDSDMKLFSLERRIAKVLIPTILHKNMNDEP